MAEKKSPEMTAKRRRSLKKSEFGLPKERKYPMDTRGRAANAKARATQQYEKGNLTMSEKKKIDKKADEVLYGDKAKKHPDRRKRREKEDMYYHDMYDMEKSKKSKKRKKDDEGYHDMVIGGKRGKMKKHYKSVAEMREDAKRKGMY